MAFYTGILTLTKWTDGQTGLNARLPDQVHRPTTHRPHLTNGQVKTVYTVYNSSYGHASVRVYIAACVRVCIHGCMMRVNMCVLCRRVYKHRAPGSSSSAQAVMDTWPSGAEAVAEVR